MKILTLCIVLSSVALAQQTPPASLETKEQLAEKFAALTLENIDIRGAARAKMAPFVQRLQDRGLPAEALSELKAELEAFTERIVSTEQIKRTLVRSYLDSYTQDDLELIVAFISSDTGKKFLAKTKDIRKQIEAPLAEEFRAQQPVLAEKIKEIASKYRSN
jgi:hypothetical protein